ncbi:hypothetical protein [Bacillus litorisediminis]|uniref:hypothetical protein n=1 Tax=Bacillus litorisediminis TaxID=2922713 RepID=UPI001FABBF61|nr:hypothetical protein [Bacillus litorisediminis]
MKPFKYTKILGILIGILTGLLALGLGYLSLVGLGFSQAFSSVINDAAILLFLVTAVILLLLGVLAGLGPFWLKRQGWRQFYIFYSITLGFCFLGVSFITRGALGNLFETVILGIGILYILQSTLVIIKK